MRRLVCGLCLFALLAIGAGCGGGDSDTAAVVSAHEVGDLGTILVDAEGRTLYVFDKDERTEGSGLSSACDGACAESWQPLLTGGEPEAEGEVLSTKLGTLERQDGTLQVTYYGHPLYAFRGDEAAGDAHGNGVTAFGGGWHALQPDNEESKSRSTTATAEGGGKRPKKEAWGVAFGAEGDPLGLIIYDLAGHTLYTFSKDRGTRSSCYGACAKAWPPALTERKPRAGGEAIAAKVGATKRKDGTVQITYAGHPLYRHAGEKQVEVNGHGAHAFGGEWNAIRPNGERP
jgi:predicted lipoprotein with Yx(FWY)xxD motif